MAFYHYTGLTALAGILNGDSDDVPNVRLWATRYDCFEDQDEYRLGINYAQKYLSILEEKRKHFSGNIIYPQPGYTPVMHTHMQSFSWENFWENGEIMAVIRKFSTLSTDLSTGCRPWG